MNSRLKGPGWIQFPRPKTTKNSFLEIWSDCMGVYKITEYLYVVRFL